MLGDPEDMKVRSEDADRSLQHWNHILYSYIPYIHLAQPCECDTRSGWPLAEKL